MRPGANQRRLRSSQWGGARLQLEASGRREWENRSNQEEEDSGGERMGPEDRSLHKDLSLPRQIAFVQFIFLVGHFKEASTAIGFAEIVMSHCVARAGRHNAGKMFDGLVCITIIRLVGSSLSHDLVCRLLLVIKNYVSRIEFKV